MIDHDRLFKELLSTFFFEFLELFVPQLAAEVDPASLSFLDKELFTDVSSGERHEVDLLVQARFRNRDSLFLVHVENQAQAQADFARRMFRYFARLHEKHLLPVYPIAVFSHEAPGIEPNEYRVQVGGWEVLRFNFQCIQLRRLHWRDYLRQPNPVAAALMARMGMEQSERARVKLECLRLLTSLRLDRARQRLISGFVDTYLPLDQAETLQFNDQADTVLEHVEKEKIMELTTSWKEEGRAEGKVEGKAEGKVEGIAEGKAEGRVEGEVRVVLRLLERRCGVLPPPLLERVRGLSLERLEDLAEALLEFNGAADLERWLH